MTRDRAQLGMAMFLISATVFFFLLILASAYFRAMPRLSYPQGWVRITLLAASSLCVWRRWRWAALALGAVFVVLLFGTTFSVLTAIHALFVLAGLVAAAVVPASAIRVMALYWYFFTAVWVVICVVASQA
jgi:heme/copper-type cytochrome/quinol oxidase subunit 3